MPFWTLFICSQMPVLLILFTWFGMCHCFLCKNTLDKGLQLLRSRLTYMQVIVWIIQSNVWIELYNEYEYEIWIIQINVWIKYIRVEKIFRQKQTIDPHKNQKFEILACRMCTQTNSLSYSMLYLISTCLSRELGRVSCTSAAGLGSAPGGYYTGSFTGQIPV